MPTKPKKAGRTPVKARRTAAPARKSPDLPRSAVVAMLRSWPPLGDGHREAFRFVVPEGDCDALGARTKAEGVLKDALVWAKVIDRALKDLPYELRRYAPPRFVWFLECVRALEDAVRSQRAKGAGKDEGKRSLAVAVQQGGELHADLVLALEVVVAGRDDGVRRLEVARTEVATPGRLATSLRALADLADEVGGSYDLRTKALVASVALRAEDAHGARAGAAAIDAAEATLAAGPPAAPLTHDLPATNRVEGRVLGEMRFAKRMFDRARALNPRVPPLQPGAATRAVLSAR